MSKRSTAGLIKYVKFLVDAGAMQRPLWLNALEKVPPPELPKPGRRPATINFPEDSLVRLYTRSHPEANLEPLDLGSFEPFTARRFAARQMELIEQGTSRREAYAQTEREFVAAAAEAPSSSTVVDVVQAEEEAHLKQALGTYTERHGHKPPVRAPPRARPPGFVPGGGRSQQQQRPQQQYQQQYQQRGPGRPQAPSAPPAASNNPARR